MTTTQRSDSSFVLPKNLFKNRQVFFAGAANRTIDDQPIPTISLRSTVKTFGFGDTTFNALDGVDLEIQRGEFVAIMGPSGCGKTTLLNILGLLDKSSTGEYFLNGKSVAKLSAARKARIRGREVGFIFQNFNLIPTLNVLDNVALPLTYQRGLKFKNLEKASKILGTFDLQNREYYLPNQLSGGQTQRVAIARALINNPAIILADEPTGNLDSKNSEIIMDELTRLHRAGNTILMVTHNPDLLSYASRVIHMKDGQIDRDIELTDTAAYKATNQFISRRKKQRSRRFRNSRMRRKTGEGKK